MEINGYKLSDKIYTAIKKEASEDDQICCRCGSEPPVVGYCGVSNCYIALCAECASEVKK